MIERYLIRDRKTGKFFCNLWQNHFEIKDGKATQMSEFDTLGECMNFVTANAVIKSLTQPKIVEGTKIYPKYRKEDLECIKLQEVSMGLKPENSENITGKAVNTKINYVYRDACNYKQHNEAVIEGMLTKKDIKIIMGCLFDGENFIPSKVCLPEVRFDAMTEDDTIWFELTKDSFERTEDKPTVPITAEEMVYLFVAAKDRWTR